MIQNGIILSRDFDEVVRDMAYQLTMAKPIDVDRWQAMATRPGTKMLELEHYSFKMSIGRTKELVAMACKPNLPWAEDHFQERVGRKPVNPGEQFKNWPFFRGNVPKHQAGDGSFSHSYMERIWPKQAGQDKQVCYCGEYMKDHCNGSSCTSPREMTYPPNMGIRFPYGDLDDVVKMLVKDPMTRQAFLPIWFPEDTGAVHGGRVPCTLGYHFMFRDEKLHVAYYIRSCDFFRHFRDDVYMAARLVQWVMDEYNNHPECKLKIVHPGSLVMHISSLHCWEAEKGIVARMGRSEYR